MAKRASVDPITPVLELFQARGWTPFDFQIEVWRAYLEGKSGLIHSATGTGKTLAAWIGPLLEHSDGGSRISDLGQLGKRNPASELTDPIPDPRLKVLWITPLKALAADTVNALRAPLEDLGIDWRVEARTGDTTPYQRAKQAKEMPDALVTTPESLSIMLSRLDGRELLSTVQCVVVDEWHELMSSKRGVQTELALARLRGFQPAMRTWGLSANPWQP